MRDTGGPAFAMPCSNCDCPVATCGQQEGMTLEDYYAGEAMKGLLANPNTRAAEGESWETFHKMISERANAQAGSMIAEKRRRENDLQPEAAG